MRRYAKAWRRRRRLLSPSQAYVPLIFDPGEAYQFDWSHEYARLAGATTKVKAAHMRLCHSRMYLVQIFPRESQEMVFEAHERAFRLFGGVCRRGVYDNMKTAVSTVFVGKKRDYNRRFQEMCSHHLIEPVARPRARERTMCVHARGWLGEGAGGEAGWCPAGRFLPCRLSSAGGAVRWAWCCAARRRAWCRCAACAT